jgi:hypothetical protein
MSVGKIELDGIVMRGLRHCSGIDEDGTEYPGTDGVVGTIRKQRPYFEEAIPGFERCYNGTINLDISPHIFELINHDYEVICDWRKNGEPQTFWFTNVGLCHNSKFHEGLVYFPCPRKGKARKRESTFELLFPFISNLNYEDEATILYSPNKIVIKSEVMK